MRPIIQSQKRIIQYTLTTLPTGGAVVELAIASAKQEISTANNIDVLVGSIVKAVYIELWYLGDGQQPATVEAVFIKSPAGNTGPDSTEFQNLNDFNNKANIFEFHQGLIGDANANPIPFWRGWVKIPKGKQRMALGDTLTIRTKAVTESAQICGMAIYKVYT